MNNDLILNAINTLKKGGVTDPKAIAKVTELAAEVQNLSDRIHVNEETSIVLEPWKEPADRIHVNQVKHVSSIDLSPWD